MLNNYFSLFKTILNSSSKIQGKVLEFIASDSKHNLYFQLDTVTLVCHLGSDKQFFFVQKKINKLPVPHFKKFKILNNKLIKYIYLSAYERVLHIIFDGGYTMRLFLFQPYSNSILFNEIGTAEEVYFQSKFEKYKDFYTQKFHYMALPNPIFIEHLTHDTDLENIIKKNYPPLGQKLILEELIHRIKSEKNGKNFPTILIEFFKEIQSEYCSLLYSKKKTVIYHYFIPYIPTFINKSFQAELFDDPNRAIQHFIRHISKQKEFQKLYSRYHNLVTQEIKYVKNSITRLKIQIRKSKDKEKYAHLAQLIMWNLNNIPVGAAEWEVVDYADSDLKKVKIKLNPTIHPREYAEKLFEKAKRLEDISSLVERLRRFENRLEALSSLLKELEEITEIKKLKHFKNELEKIGIEWTSTDKAGHHQPQRIPYREYYFNNYIIRVGKSAKESDELTLKISKKYDWFFHAQDIRGSHVIVTHSIKDKLEQLPPEVIETAAITAAYFSEAKNSSYVPVQYTQVRHVRKPRKSPAGFVIFHQYKTIFVEPSKFNQLNLLTKKEAL